MGVCVSLDRPIVPTTPTIVQRIAVCVGVLVIVALVKQVLSVLSMIRVDMRGAGVKVLEPIADVLDFLQYELVPELSEALRLKFGQVRAFAGDTLDFWRDVFSDAEPEPVDMTDWHVCTIKEREKLSDDFVRYRFRLQRPNQLLPCAIGQEITLCCVDSDDRVLKEGYIGIQPRKAKGYFDVLVKRTKEEGSPDKFVRSLEKLAIGDEVAFKEGKQRLLYQGDDEKIDSLSLVASGVGIAMALHLAQELLPAKDSSVKSVEILWLNENEEDFVLADEIEQLYYKYNRRLRVNCILETDLYGHDLGRVAGMQNALAKYSKGRMAAVSGPGYLVEKIRRHMCDKLGYPFESIVQIKM